MAMYNYNPDGGEAEAGGCLRVSWAASLTKSETSWFNDKRCLKQ